MASRINGKIAAFITPKRVAINRGTSHGVEDGMLFAVKLVVPDIVDPDDPDTVLSGIFYEKARLRVTSAFDKMSFGEVEARGATKLLEALLGESNFPPFEGAPILKEDDWVLRVGDPVISLPSTKS